MRESNLWLFVLVGLAALAAVVAGGDSSSDDVPTGEYLGINDEYVYRHDNSTNESTALHPAPLRIGLSNGMGDGVTRNCDTETWEDDTIRGCSAHLLPAECTWTDQTSWWNEENGVHDLAVGRCLSLNVYPGSNQDTVKVVFRLGIKATDHMHPPSVYQGQEPSPTDLQTLEGSDWGLTADITFDGSETYPDSFWDSDQAKEDYSCPVSGTLVSEGDWVPDTGRYTLCVKSPVSKTYDPANDPDLDWSQYSSWEVHFKVWKDITQEGDRGYRAWETYTLKCDTCLDTWS